jgi:RNA polymerase sigma-70 factor, ECF subfamily
MNTPIPFTSAIDEVLSMEDAQESLHGGSIDARCMERVAAGDESAFEELVIRHQKYLLNFFTRMGVQSECDDLVQNTFIQLYQYRDRYQATAKFTTFLHVLAYRVWADLGRKKLRREKLAACLRVAAESTETATQEPYPGMDVQAALDKLSPKLRDVVVLHFYQGLPYQEIADVLEIPLGTVKSRLNLAINALREIFHE